MAVSSSADLPRLRALPEVLEYPHGCFEQVTSRVLVYCGVQPLFEGLPIGPNDTPSRRTVERALEQCGRSLLPDGRLPYWSSQTEGNPFVTVQAGWAARLAARAGFKVDAELLDKLDEATGKIAADQYVAAEIRAFALFSQASRAGTAPSDEGSDLDETAAKSIFLHRETLGDEGRALLAVALHRAKAMPDEKRQLLREILPLANGSKPVPARAFDPATFSSTDRTGAMTIWAFSEVRPPEWKTGGTPLRRNCA